MPIIDLPDDELAAVAAAIRRAIEDDRYPRAPRLDPLRAALARLDAAMKPTPDPIKSRPGLDSKPEGRAASQSRQAGAAINRVLNIKGGGVPSGAVYIGRAAPRYGLRASKWANPFVIGRHGDRDEVIAEYERWLRDERPDLMAALPELRGKDLVCWCAPLACHGDVILRLAGEGSQ